MSLRATLLPLTALCVGMLQLASAQAVSFYTKYLGFKEKPGATPNFTMLSPGNLDLVLSRTFGPGGAAKPLPDELKGGGSVEKNHHQRRRFASRSREAAQSKPAFPERYHLRAGRIRDLIGRSFRKPNRTLPPSR